MGRESLLINPLLSALLPGTLSAPGLGTRHTTAGVGQGTGRRGRGRMAHRQAPSGPERSGTGDGGSRPTGTAETPPGGAEGLRAATHSKYQGSAAQPAVTADRTSRAPLPGSRGKRRPHAERPRGRGRGAAVRPGRMRCGRRVTAWRRFTGNGAARRPRSRPAVVEASPRRGSRPSRASAALRRVDLTSPARTSARTSRRAGSCTPGA